MHLEQDCPDEAGDGGLVGKDADDIGAPLDLAVQSFERVGGMQLGPVSGREVHVGQHIGLGFVHEGGEFRQFGAQLVGDLAPLRLGRLGVLLCEGGGDEGRSDPATVAPGMGEQVAHQMHTAALPGGHGGPAYTPSAVLHEVCTTSVAVAARICGSEQSPEHLRPSGQVQLRVCGVLPS